MKFGLLSMCLLEGNTQYNADTIINCIKQYADTGIDLLCFGESFLHGFDSLNFSYEHDVKVAVSSDSGIICSIQEAARHYKIGVSFGYYENDNGILYSSQVVFADTGERICNFKRVSEGWKEHIADKNLYKEGPGFDVFLYKGKRISIGLCGDLWNDDNVRRIRETNADIVLWPVYLDYSIENWDKEKHDYAARAKEICSNVLLVNSICDGDDRANGGAVYFKDGVIAQELSAGSEGILIVDVH